MKKLLLCLMFLPALYVPEAHAIVSSLTLHDAVFSPDGDSIGVGTAEGFTLLDSATRRPVYSFSMENGVRFLKWASDGKRVLLASWKEEEVPTYSVLDLDRNKTLCSFQEEARWYYAHYFGIWDDSYRFTNRLEEGIYPEAKRLGHPANAAFSPDGGEIAFITQTGGIVIRNAETGEAVRTFAMPGHHLASIGYSDGGLQLWAGEYTWTEERGQDSFLHFFDSKTGRLIRSRQINTDSLQDHKPVLVYEMSKNEEETLALSVYRYTGMPDPQVTAAIHLFDMVESKGKEIVSRYDFFLFSLRARFGSSNQVFGLVDCNQCEYTRFTINDLNHNVGRNLFFSDLPELESTSQPLAPDGTDILMNVNNLLLVIDSKTGKYERVDLQSAGVGDAPLHEMAETRER